MKLAAILAVSLAAGAACPCRARLWDSPEQFEQRFGSPRLVGDDAPFGDIESCTLHKYERDGLICFAYFQGGKCICECFARTKGELSAVEVEEILRGDTFNKLWINFTEKIWRKSDYSATAAMVRAGGREFAVISVPLFDSVTSPRHGPAEGQKKVRRVFYLHPVVAEALDAALQVPGEQAGPWCLARWTSQRR